MLAVKTLPKYTLVFSWLWLAAVSQTSARVIVTVPQPRYRRYETITNQTAKPISVCVEFGHLSMRGSGAEDVEATPTPVYVQAMTGSGAPF